MYYEVKSLMLTIEEPNINASIPHFYCKSLPQTSVRTIDVCNITVFQSGINAYQSQIIQGTYITGISLNETDEASFIKVIVASYEYTMISGREQLGMNRAYVRAR